MRSTPRQERNKGLRDARRDNANERRHIKEQRERIRERMRQTERLDDGKRAEAVRRHNAVVTGIVPRISGAIDSWVNRRVPLGVTYPAPSFSALTDFTAIDIRIPYLETDMSLDFAADLRGLAYHEAGHILKSVPFSVLLNQVMPAESDDSRYSRDRGVYKMLGLSHKETHYAWNMLEDQRMETAMVRESRNLGRYYNVIVLTHVLGRPSPSAFLLLHGRKHVDATVRASARQAFALAYGEDKAVQAETIIDAYKRTDDPLVMWQQTVRMGWLVQEIGAGGDLGEGSVDSHGDPEDERWEEMDSDDLDEMFGSGADPGNPDDDDKATDQRQCQGDKGQSDKSDKDDKEGDDDEADAEALGDTADRRAQGTHDGPTVEQGASHSTSDPDWTRELVREALEEAKDARRQDGTITRDVRAYNEAFTAAKDSLPIQRIPTLPDPDPAVTAEAIKLNRALRNLMEQARSEQAPSWQTQQRRGVLDVRAYLTRQPGDMEFFRDYCEGGDMRLPNMAVSLLLDGSGSMEHLSQELATAAFGVKTACDVVGVPCTVTVYDSDAYLLWDHEDRPLDVPHNIVPNGGTDPKTALDLLDRQVYGKDNHLVIIMTDGAWSGRWYQTLSLAHYQAPGRDMVMFYLGGLPWRKVNGIEACSTDTEIETLSEIPRYLQRYLLRAM
jgi:hypothetical protein